MDYNNYEMYDWGNDVKRVFAGVPMDDAFASVPHYTEKELYEQYKNTNLFEEEEQIGWGGYSTYGHTPDFETFQEVCFVIKCIADI